MKNRWLFLLAIMVLNPAWADPGTSVGNGGQSVVCKNARGVVMRTEALDLFEGRVLSGYRYSRSPRQSAEEMAIALAKKIDLSQGGSLGGTSSLEGKVRFVISHLIFLPKGVGLKPTEDSREFVFPKDCELVQTINFRQNLKIFVDSDVWSTLSMLDKAAMYLHEAVYWHLRESGVEKDSRRTRKIVSYLFAGGELSKRILLEPSTVKVQYCHSQQFNDRQDWNTKLIAFKNQENKLVIQFLQVGAFRLLTKTLLQGEPDAELPPFEPIQKDIDALKEISGAINSPVDPDAVFKITWGKGKISLSGSLQEGNSVQDDLECMPWEITW